MEKKSLSPQLPTETPPVLTAGAGDGKATQPRKRSAAVKQAKKDLETAFEASNCSDIVKDYYIDRIKDLEKVHSDDTIVESRVQDMIKLIKDVGCG